MVVGSGPADVSPQLLKQGGLDMGKARLDSSLSSQIQVCVMRLCLNLAAGTGARGVHHHAVSARGATHLPRTHLPAAHLPPLHSLAPALTLTLAILSGLRLHAILASLLQIAVLAILLLPAVQLLLHGIELLLLQIDLLQSLLIAALRIDHLPRRVQLLLPGVELLLQGSRSTLTLSQSLLRSDPEHQSGHRERTPSAHLHVIHRCTS
jgi:hypothetical protein